MRPHPCPLLLALGLLATACGGGDPLPAAGPDEPPAAPSPRAATSPAPSPGPSPSPSPSPAPSESPGPRRTITLVGLGNPPPEPPLRGTIEVEAIVRTDRPSWTEFYVDGAWVNADARWPYVLGGGRYDTRRLPDGEHSLRARAVFPDSTSIEVTQPFWVRNDGRGQTARAVGERLEVVVDDGAHDLAFALEEGAAAAYHWVVEGRDFARGCGDAPDLAVEPRLRVEDGRLVGEVRWAGRAADCGGGGGTLAIDAPLERGGRSP